MVKKFLKACSILFFSGVVITLFVSCTNRKSTETGYTGEMINVVDGKGEVTVSKNPKKVVVFDYGILDILDSIGVEVVGLPKATLPDKFSKYKDDKYVDLGGLKDPDFEAINNIKPDLIIVNGRQEAMLDKFKEIGNTIYLNLDGAKYFESLNQNAKILGEIFEKKDEVIKEINEINDKVKEINSYVSEKKLNALIVMVDEGSLKTYGVGSKYGLIYSDLGFESLDNNIKVSTHGQQISFEYIVDKNPMYIFVIDRGAALGNESTAKTILDNKLIKSTDAYKNNRILYMDSQIWYTASGGFSTTKSMLDEVWNFIQNN